MAIFKKRLLNAEIAALEQKADELRERIKSKEEFYNNLKQKADEEQARYNELRESTNVVETRQEYCVPYYDDSLDELEHKRHGMQAGIDAEISKGLYRVERQYTVDGSAAKGRELQKTMGDGFCYAMNCYFAEKEKTLTETNIEKSKDLIAKRFNTLQKKANKIGIAMNSEYIRKRLYILDVNLAIKINKKKEMAKIREEKRRLREQEQLLAEIAKEEALLEKERKAMNVAFAKALTDAERNQIKDDMAKIDKRLNNLRYRREHHKSGWLYVISSPSLPNIIKIGCTRRLNPTIRVRELSSSSLPFPFKTHGFVFSDDCFTLESVVHQYFNDKRVAPDREFFNITPKEAIDVLKNKFGVEVHFVDLNEDDEQEDSE